MTTAVDTNVLLDLYEAESDHTLAAAKALEAAAAEGPLVISQVVYAELAPTFADHHSVDASLEDMGISIPQLSREGAFKAGTLFARYRRSGGDRSRILPDFLIAAHAIEHADCLLSRDRGFYRKHFPQLVVVKP